MIPHMEPIDDVKYSIITEYVDALIEESFEFVQSCDVMRVDRTAEDPSSRANRVGELADITTLFPQARSLQ